MMATANVCLFWGRNVEGCLNILIITPQWQITSESSGMMYVSSIDLFCSQM